MELYVYRLTCFGPVQESSETVPVFIVIKRTVVFAVVL